MCDSGVSNYTTRVSLWYDNQYGMMKTNGLMDWLKCSSKLSPDYLYYQELLSVYFGISKQIVIDMIDKAGSFIFENIGIALSTYH